MWRVWVSICSGTWNSVVGKTFVLFRNCANSRPFFCLINLFNSKMVKYSCHKFVPILTNPSICWKNIQESTTGFNWNTFLNTGIIMLTPPKGLHHPFNSCSCKLMKLNIPAPTMDISSINTTFRWKYLHLMESSWCMSSGLKANPRPTGIPKGE